MSSIMMVGVALAVVAVFIICALLGRRSGNRLATATAGANMATNPSNRPVDKPATQIGTVFSSAGFGGDLPDLGGITRESIGEESLTGMQFTPDGGYVIRRKKTRTCMPSDDVINTRPIFLVGGGGVQTFKASDVVVDRGTRRESSDDDKEGHTAATPDKSVRGTGRPADQPDRRPDPDRGRPAKDATPVKAEPDTTSASTKVPPVSTADIAISGLPREATSQDIRALVEGTNSVVKGVRMAKGGEASVTIEGNDGYARVVAKKLHEKELKGVKITARLASDTASSKPLIIGKGAGAVHGAASAASHSSTTGKPAPDADPDAEASNWSLPVASTVEIENLPYEVTEDDLHEMFTDVGCKPTQVIVPKASGRPGNRGFAWVVLENPDTAKSAVDEMTGTTWGRAVLEMRVRGGKYVIPTKSAKPATTTKVVPPPVDLADYTIVGVSATAADATVASAPKAKTPKKGKTK